MRGIGMQIRRRHRHRFLSSEKIKKHERPALALRFHFQGFPTRCDRAGNQTNKKFPSTNNNIDHNLFVPIDFFT
jgi:hypothetical protein